MKKKIGLLSVLVVAVVSLTACGSGNQDQAESSSEVSSMKDSSTASSASSEVVDRAVIKGTLKEDVTVDGENVSFLITEVEGVDDPHEIAKGINEEGVILNVTSKQVEGEFNAADFSKGQVIEVTLEANPIMTRSLPPQIPGASIISIKKQ